MSKLLGSFPTNTLLNQAPCGNCGVFFRFIVFVFILETVVSQVHHEICLIFDILFSVILNAETQVSFVKKYDAGVAVYKHVTSDIEFFIV
jgi:hypothetical protein